MAFEPARLARLLRLMKQGQETVKRVSIKFQVGVADEGGWDCVQGMETEPVHITGLLIDEPSVRDAMAEGHRRFAELNPKGKASRTSGKSSRGGRGGHARDPGTSAPSSSKRRSTSPLNTPGSKALRMCWVCSSLSHQARACPQLKNTPATTWVGAPILGGTAAAGGKGAAKSEAELAFW